MARRIPWVFLAVALLLIGPSITNGQGVTPTSGAASQMLAVPMVIALDDGGINPYHIAFRAPTWTAHPSTFIPGYPEDALPFEITLEAPSFRQAWAADEPKWNALEEGQLYYIPGTRIVGAIFPPGGPTDERQVAFYDVTSHGTIVSDAAAGNEHGIDPEAAIVMVGRGYIDQSAWWVAHQRWIDFLSISHGCPGGVVWPTLVVKTPTPWYNTEFPTDAEPLYEIYKQGRLTIAAAGNGLAPQSQTCTTQGAPWTMNVGKEQDVLFLSTPSGTCPECERPVEVFADGQGVFAMRDTMEGTEFASGSSISAPRMAGYASRLVREARVLLRDPTGISDGAYARAPPGVPIPTSGPLADGDLSLDELWTLLTQTASPAPTSVGEPEGLVPTHAKYLRNGYGVFGEPEYQRALAVMKGESTLLPRPYDDMWHAVFKNVGRLYWEPWVCRYELPYEEYHTCWLKVWPPAIQNITNALAGIGPTMRDEALSFLPPDVRALLPDP